MSELELHPFAAQIEWVLDLGISADEWKSLLSDYFETLAQKSVRLDKTVIGHIKGFAILPEDGFIQISAVSASHPASTNIKNGSFGSYQSLSMTLNFLVYGLPFAEAERIAQESAIDLMDKIGGQATFSMVSDPNQVGH